MPDFRGVKGSALIAALLVCALANAFAAEADTAVQADSLLLPPRAPAVGRPGIELCCGMRKGRCMPAD